MPIAIWCILVAGLMPIVVAGVAKRGDRSFDNNDPRGWESRLEGWRKRLYASHRNGLEAFPFFATAVLCAWTQGASQDWVDGLAAVFILLRVVYHWAYYADRASLRSAMFGADLLVAVAIFLSPLWSAGPGA